MSRKGKAKPWESAILNNLTYEDIYNRLRLIGINRIEYENWPKPKLPNGIEVDQRFVEQTLWEQGAILWFQDEVMGDVCLPFSEGTPLSIYNVPMVRRAYSSTGYSASRTYKNSVIIYNNYLRMPDQPTIDLFALRIADIQRSIDVNVKAQKTPKFITTSEKQRMTVVNMMMQYEGNEVFIVGDNDLAADVNLNALDISSPYVADKLLVQMHNTWNDALTYYGIENSNQDKRERLVADEVSSNYGAVEANRNNALNARKQGFDLVNKMFGHNIRPRFKSDIITTVNDPNLTGGANNGEVYDGSTNNRSGE